ncbi:TPA: hypothetical protein DEO28_00115 [Candidatus Dependentiae bacterium]|nr:MAG: hypothetical protein UR14_C0001G0119 [candidate division TM6 bacterium GW2011_GWE2_31_21]KKP54001.1 MAG: hypothetical protein UR43_C0001G0019 [candidate division TM6 bacterium GW2011_GWF2_33_332]HBS48418.1 hypothetical protein [Candidatus Dependentiae bacterium]HBZ72908.1 hypothetical protein [Candidatus Dependentiae bacterium]
MKKSKLRDIYESIRYECQDYDIYEDCINRMKNAAESDPVEFEDLINLLSEEKYEGNKLTLAEVLVLLKWMPIKNILHELIEKSCDLGNKIEAIEYLVDMRDERAIDYIINTTQEAYEKKDNHYLISAAITLLRLENKKGTQAFLKLVNKYEELKKYCEGKEFFKEVKKLANE